MKRREAIRDIGVASAVVFCCPLSMWSRTAEEQDLTLHSDARLVVLDVSVKDRLGKLVPDLTKDSFAVFENGKRQEISVFAHDDLPVTVGILVDESYSMSPKRAEVLAAAETFISASNPRDEIFVLNFNDEVTRGLPGGTLFSDDLLHLRAALHRGVAQGKTALHDAIAAGLEQLGMGSRDKKALVLISDGGDNASRHTRKEMLDAVRASVATIYTVGIFDTRDPDRDPGVLKELAKMSGGVAYFPAATSEMIPVCRNIANDIRTRYTIGYVPPAENNSALRHIHVHASTPVLGSLSVRTRTSYRYAKAESETK